MCGIVGTYGKSSRQVERRLDRLRHRGPDGCAVQHQTYGSLGHARLAIVDVDGGQQPLSDPAGRRWLICNGEIYNHEQLRAEFPDYPFQTRSDSEVILALYDRYGPELVNRLDGMFAFALIDEEGLFMARDPLGIKPLYYAQKGGTLHFASEIKALQGIRAEIKEFPPGHWYTTAGGLVPYYDVAAVAGEASARIAWRPSLARVREGLRTAVHKRLMSDVPLGVFLSGGLDSSIVSALVCQNLGAVHSFAVGMEGSPDLLFARRASRYLGTQHHEYRYTVRDMVEALPQVIYYLESFDPALVRSAIPNFFLARLAREYVAVVLSGEGADELYSGYDYLRQFTARESLERELVEITAELHNRNLQRLDRMTMAHGLEGRVPFLDRDFVALSFSVPAGQKLFRPYLTEKWVLRKAFAEMLPDEIVWRAKQKFSAGSGSSQVFEQLAEAEINDAEFAQEQLRIFGETGHQVRSKEELFYYRVFRRYFDVPVTALVGRSRSL